jgi:hypothetical protein
MKPIVSGSGVKFSTSVPSSLASLTSLVLYLYLRPAAYPEMEPLKDASLMLALALFKNIRLGWKDLEGQITNICKLQI